MGFNFKSVPKSLSKSFFAWLSSVRDLVHEPYKWVLHPSAWRFRWFGLLQIGGHPSFYWLWSSLVPQPFESLLLRSCMSLLSLTFIVHNKSYLLGLGYWRYYYNLILYIQLPLFFLFMAYMNSFNAVWLGSCVAMVMIYYQLCDWRIATINVALTLVLFVLTHFIFGSANVSELFVDNLIEFCFVFSFAWASATLMGASAANLVKQNLLNTSFNLGVMAHELRTPISSINIINHLLKNKAADIQDSQLLQLSTRLGSLLKTINLHIDYQIANSKQDHKNIVKSPVQALNIVNHVVDNYPFKSKFEQNAIRIICKQDFIFLGNEVLFIQTLNNLVKNALHAMYAKELPEDSFLLTIELSQSEVVHPPLGIIVITDNGVGIKPSEITRVLEPFVSSAGAIGHGLGLPFCKSVLNSFNGKLRISSIFGTGTSIRLELPILGPSD